MLRDIMLRSGASRVHCILCVFSHPCQYSVLWLKHLNVCEMPFQMVLLTLKWLNPLNRLICAMALPAGNLVYRLPKLLKLNNNFLF